MPGPSHARSPGRLPAPNSSAARPSPARSQSTRAIGSRRSRDPKWISAAASSFSSPGSPNMYTEPLQVRTRSASFAVAM